MQCMEVKLGTHVYFSISMTTMNKKWPWALFLITTSSLLKLANHAMHGSETWYAYVFQCFHANHEQKMASGTFPITTSTLLKLANHAMHGSETWYASVFQRFHDNHEQKISLGTFRYNYFFSSLANHSGEICTQVCLSVSMMSSSLRHSISIHTIGIFFIGACPPLNDLH